jgi:multiple sugar transport system substrate-binding protein
VFDYFYFGLGALVDAGALVDLTDQLGATDTADFLPSVYDAYTLLDGRRYGVPFDGDVPVLYYNREVFETYGLAPPAIVGTQTPQQSLTNAQANWERALT